MKIELVVAPDCPHKAAAADLLRAALSDVGLPPGFETVTIDDRAVGGFAGSPTFRVDGADLFPTASESVGSSCRIYRNSGGVGGLPDLRALRQALERDRQRRQRPPGHDHG